MVKKCCFVIKILGSITFSCSKCSSIYLHYSDTESAGSLSKVGMKKSSFYETKKMDFLIGTPQYILRL